MSQGEMQIALVVWTIGGAVLGWIAWRILPQPKYVLEKIMQGVIGANLFGWFVLISVPKPWRHLVSHIAALAMGFLLPFWGSRVRKNRQQ